MVSYEVWQRFMPVYFAYYAGIMLDAFGYCRICYHTLITVTYSAFNYAGIIGLGLATTCGQFLDMNNQHDIAIISTNFNNCLSVIHFSYNVMVINLFNHSPAVVVVI